MSLPAKKQEASKKETLKKTGNTQDKAKNERKEQPSSSPEIKKKLFIESRIMDLEEKRQKDAETALSLEEEQRLKGKDKRKTESLKDTKEVESPRRRDKFLPEHFKTEICRSHRLTGYCEYAENCQFAHGVEELRPRRYGVKYKTQLCKNYHIDGLCRFGSRCKFIHDEKRIQVGDREFWLISPSENLVRVEVVENAQRAAQLASLSEASCSPPAASTTTTATTTATTALATPDSPPLPLSLPQLSPTPQSISPSSTPTYYSTLQLPQPFYSTPSLVDPTAIPARSLTAPPSFVYGMPTPYYTYPTYTQPVLVPYPIDTQFQSLSLVDQSSRFISSTTAQASDSRPFVIPPPRSVSVPSMLKLT